MEVAMYVRLLFVMLACAVLTGCLDRELKPLNPCLVAGVSNAVAVKTINKVDLLFVIDDSQSMKEEQEALARELPRLIETLTTGDRGLDGTIDFQPAKDLRLGVVSTDLGIGGARGVGGCDGPGGDGVLLHEPAPGVAGCQASYPSFLSYRVDADDPQQVARDFACISTLGTEGCGFEQQLEATLKALWPSSDDRVTFLDDTGAAMASGQGDRANLGFLRNDPEDPSVLAVVLVTDEEDCSSGNTVHFNHPDWIPESASVAAPNDLNLRCFQNSENLYPVTRYVDALRALRPGLEDLLVFGAIVGVPPDSVAEDARVGVDFKNDAQRDAFYQSILDHPRMQEQIDPARTMAGSGNLKTSCNTDSGVAYPPRRIVEVARQLGEGSVVQSICQESFAPAIDAIIERIGSKLSGLCLPRELVRRADDMVGCDVVWELPAPGGPTPAGTPTDCAALPFLEPTDPPAAGDRGGMLCRVTQLPVRDGAVATPGAEGWFYDDFSQDVLDTCGDEGQRVGFTAAAAPPSGVTVTMQCLNEEPTLIELRDDVAPNVEPPGPGSPCDSVVRNGQELTGDAACEVPLAFASERFPDGVDRRMFCHPELNVCVRACGSDADCPSAWSCDTREPTRALVQSTGRGADTGFCVNPTCGDGR
jgi:hypothetical protein